MCIRDRLAGHDYSKTAFSYVERDTAHEIWVEVPEQPDAFDPLAEEVLAGSASATADPGREDSRPEELATGELIARGESGRVEFKQTARINVATKQRDQVIELMVIKSVAGFMNAHGGTLLIGVNDRGEVFGIEKDLKTLGSKQNRDGFELWLTGLLDNTLGPTGTSRVSISCEDFPEGTVCRVDVTPGNKPTFGSQKASQAASSSAKSAYSPRRLCSVGTRSALTILTVASEPPLDSGSAGTQVATVSP